jgi:16S rRNA (cytidine1402-2'-O)-methyltransferase
MALGSLPNEAARPDSQAGSVRSKPREEAPGPPSRTPSAGSRLAASLADLAETLGPRRDCVVARELTKLFEEVRSGTLEELAAHYETNGAPKGEIVVLIGPPEVQAAEAGDIDAALLDAMQRLPMKAAANEVADVFGLSKRDLYQRALQLKNG